jgi:Fe-S-cluster formation regulator IscX/YfhJ
MDEEEIVYPKPTDTLIDQTQSKVLFTDWFAGDWHAFPFAYKAAADALVDRLEVDRGNHTVTPDDRFVFPILFLYRHFVELQLKSLIVQLDNFTQEPLDKEKFMTHNLLALWKHIKDNLQHLIHAQVNPSGIRLLNRLIVQLANIDDDSYHSRYPMDRKLKPMRVPRSLSMDNLKSVMTAMGNSLNLIAEAIDNEKAYWYAQDSNWTEDEDSVPWNNFVYY